MNDDATVLINQVKNSVQSLIGGGGLELPNDIPITDGIHLLDDANNTYTNFSSYEALADGGISMGTYDSLTQGLAFSQRKMTSKNIIVSGATNPNVAGDFFGLECSNLQIDGTISVNSYLAGGFAGLGGQSGTNMMSGKWDFMPRGGDSGAPGGTGFSGGGTYGGGGVILIIADSISGVGTFEARGESGSPSGHTPGGGGGMIIILTKAWDGHPTLDVNAGTTYGGTPGQVGSYCILKINTDGTLTLMVHSENGVSAPLNGQTPVHGADASIAW